MKRFAIAGSLAAALAVAGLAGATAFAGPGKPGKLARPSAKSLPPVVGQVNFTSGCAFSHTAPDDPIVYPGVPGASHQHSFVGNRSTNAASTLASLQAAATSCRRQADKAAYWMPTLYRSGQPIQPTGATVYYRRGTKAPVKPFPLGLKIIAGSSMATTPQSLQVTFWSCGVEDSGPSSTVPTCPDAGPRSLRLHVRFPECWDGTSLDSSDHKSHMAYAVRRMCSATHPVSVPAIAMIFKYPIDGGPNVVLASGGQYSGHADFFNAWDPAVLAGLVDFCLNGLRHCGPLGP